MHSQPRSRRRWTEAENVRPHHLQQPSPSSKSSRESMSDWLAPGILTKSEPMRQRHGTILKLICCFGWHKKTHWPRAPSQPGPVHETTQTQRYFCLLSPLKSMRNFCRTGLNKIRRHSPELHKTHSRSKRDSTLIPKCYILSLSLSRNNLIPRGCQAALSLKGKAGRLRLDSLNNKLAE